MSNSPPFNHAPLTLRDYQIDIVDQVDELDHPLVPLLTGWGKAVIAAAIIKEAVNPGEHELFIVQRRELVHQASAKLLARGVDHDANAIGVSR